MNTLWQIEIVFIHLPAKLTGMKSIYLLCFLVIALGMAACKNDSTTQTEETTSTPAQSESGNQAVKANPSQASSQATGQGHDYTFLTDKLFHYKAAFGGKTAKNQTPFKDEWIDLLSDGTFKAGKLKEQTHTGQWSYNHDTKILFLRPDTDKFKMSEWKVMYNEHMMVWVGTQTYGDNSIQVQLAKSDVLP